MACLFLSAWKVIDDGDDENEDAMDCCRLVIMPLQPLPLLIMMIMTMKPLLMMIMLLLIIMNNNNDNL